jgi:hypothetical protein
MKWRAGEEVESVPRAEHLTLPSLRDRPLPLRIAERGSPSHLFRLLSAGNLQAVQPRQMPFPTLYAKLGSFGNFYGLCLLYHSSLSTKIYITATARLSTHFAYFWLGTGSSHVAGGMAVSGDGTGKLPAAVAIVLAPRKLSPFDGVSMAVTPRIETKSSSSAQP